MLREACQSRVHILSKRFQDMDKMPLLKCEYCGKISVAGALAIQVCKGIVGVLGFVPLDPPITLCSLECLERWYGNGAGKEQAWMPRRKP